MNRVVVVGSLNCDLVVRAPRRPRAGETLRGTSFDTFVGGKGCNQAIACARAGAEVALIGRTGADSFADVLSETLRASNVDDRAVVRDAEEGTGIAVIQIDDAGDNAIVVVPRANDRLSPADVDASAALFEGASWVLLALEIPEDTVLAAARKAKACGARVALNPAPAPTAPLSPELLALVDVAIPNETEAESLAGCDARELEGASRCARAIRDAGAREVIVTRGASGAIWLDARGVVAVVDAFEVAALDTTAAGDAFVGALVASLAGGRPMHDALVHASAAGALACTRLGAAPSLPWRADIDRLAAHRHRSV